jgi:membrane protein DedA with SNARE-associated domain
MNLQSFVESYGYAAIVVGTFLEGETILVMGGFAAHLGHLGLPGVILAATLGSYVRCGIFFFLGRWHGEKALARRRSWQTRADKTHRLLEHYELPVMLGFRFLYGLGIVTPIMIGMSRISTVRFIVLNAIGALIWASVVALAGYLFGQALETLFGHIKRYELEVMCGIAAAGALFWLIHFIRRVRRRQAA